MLVSTLTYINRSWGSELLPFCSCRSGAVPYHVIGGLGYGELSTADTLQLEQILRDNESNLRYIGDTNYGDY